MEGLLSTNHPITKQRLSPQKSAGNSSHFSSKQNQVGTVMLYGIPIVSLVIESQERLCLAQISNTLLKQYSYNEIHNRRVALGITCVQCTPVQLEILRRAGAMPVSSRRCGMITRREAERLCKSFLGDNAPPRLPDDFAFSVHHECAWGCRGAFLPSRYNSSRAKCIKCTFCGLFFSPNKFIFHSHRTSPNATYVQPDAANFNSWRRHMKLSGSPPDDVVHAWEDVKAMFNGGTRKRLLTGSSGSGSLSVRSTIASTTPITITSAPNKQLKLDTSTSTNSPYPTPSNTPIPVPTPPRVPPFPDLALPISMMDYVWQNGVNSEGVKHQFPFAPYAVPWFSNAKRSVLGLSALSSSSSQQESFLQHLCPSNSEKLYHHSAFRPVFPAFGRSDILLSPSIQNNVVKRQITPEELLLPKKRYLRESENVESGNSDFTGSEDSACRSNVEEIRNGFFNKENELKKSFEESDNRDSEIKNGSSQNTLSKITFKKELINDASDDSEETPKDFLRAQTGQEGKELVDVTKFLSLKPNLIEESVLRYREFSPNLREAISNIKTEERGVLSGIAVKMYERKVVESFEECNMRKIGHVEGEEESKSEEDEEEEEEDEPVDVETTDDVPLGENLVVKSQSNSTTEQSNNITTKVKQEEHKVHSGGDPQKPNRIWTIARFSVEESDRETSQASDFSPSQEQEHFSKPRKDVERLKGSAPDQKRSRMQNVECMNCCPIAYGNG